MPYARFLTFGDRAYRREKMIAAYRRGYSSRAVAEQFGMTDSYVRQVMRDAGVVRRPGRPKWPETACVHVGIPSANAITGLPTFNERSA